MPPRSRTLALHLAAALLTASIAGCGASPQQKAEAAKGVFTSSSDCAESGILTIEQCMQAMSAAVVAHEKSAPTYSELRRCEATEGANKCEHTHAGRFRPRLLAFLIVASEPPVATPLYAAPKGEAGFRAADNKLYLEKDETIRFSSHAQTLFEAHLKKDRSKRPL